MEEEEEWVLDWEEERHNGTGTLLSFVGVPWIAALHCSSWGVTNTSRCAMESIATIWLLGSDNLFLLSRSGQSPSSPSSHLTGNATPWSARPPAT
eukprot:756770-Hanusia_phi.AAC.1